MEKGQREYFLRQQLKAIQEELGEGDAAAGRGRTSCASGSRRSSCPEDVQQGGRRASSRGSRSCRRRPPSTASSAPTSTGSSRCRGTETTEDNLDLEHARADPRRGPLRPREGQGADHRVPRGREAARTRSPGRSSASSARPASARRRSASRSRARSGASSCASPSAASATRRRSAATGARTSARCPARSSARSATPSRATRVLLIDEIDKMGADFRGDPASAMLEVLDPEQNSTFRDHYLDLPFDLSKVLFICTANTLDTIPGPLLDRMDVIQLSGYTEEEKLGIARALPRPEAARGARPDASAARRSRTTALRLVIREYTREAGVREPRAADRRRSAARRRRRSRRARRRRCASTRRGVREWLGPRRFSGEVRKRTADPGVATGLAVHRRRRRRALHRGDRVPRQGPAARSPASSAR